MEWIQFIQEAPTWLEPLPIIVRGEVATLCDQNTWKHALILQCCFCAELPEAPYLRNPIQLKQWLLSIVKEDVGILGKNLKHIATEIRHYASLWRMFDYNEFKAHCGWSSMGTFFSPIKDYITSYLSNPQADTLKVLLQWTCFLTRITLNTGFHSDISEFLAVESRLRGLEPNSLWDELREVLNPIAKRFTLEGEFEPMFSQGANSDAPKGLGMWGKVKEGWHVTGHHRYLLSMCGWNVLDCPEEESRHCKLVFVPKGIDSQRAICEEPTFSMFLQQGILRQIQRWFSHDFLISRHINLEDQEVQRERARQATLTLDTATLDLSAASDSVSWRLVEYVFEGTKLLECLRLTRTGTVQLPSGEIFELEKFAPMGSALCFPTECLMFLGICLLGCKRKGVYPSIGVYGDDLVVPWLAEDEVHFLLTQFGFQLNEKKSFWGHERFKESCGGEYLDGNDVAPLYIPRKFLVASKENHPESLETYTDLCNSLYWRGYKLMRRFLLSSIILPTFPGVRFSSDFEKGIFSPMPTNFHLRERWNSDLQRLEVRHQAVINLGDRVSDDEARYLLLLLQYKVSTRSMLFYPEDRIEVDLSLLQLGVGWRWGPAEDSAASATIIAVDGSVILLNR